MKIRAFISKICEKCQPIRRRSRIIVICSNPRHKQDKDNLFKKKRTPKGHDIHIKRDLFDMKWIYPYISDLYL